MDGALTVATDGPFAVPGRRNLLSVALAATDAMDAFAGQSGLDPAWANGFKFLADSCDALDPLPTQCGVSDMPKDMVEDPDIVTVAPFLTFGADQCSALDNGRDGEARARRNLLATESWQIERELFDGVATKTTSTASPDPGPSLYLTDGNTATDATGGGSALPALRALARLEQELLSCLHGQRGVIHAIPELVTLWQGGGALRVEGNTILTVLDTLIVPGAGYSGNDPDGDAATTGTTWAYGTGLVYLRQGQIFDPASGDPASRVDRERNTRIWRLERQNAIYFAPCCVKAVHSSLTS